MRVDAMYRVPTGHSDVDWNGWGSEEGELGVKKAEGEAMMRGGAVCGDGGSMIGSGVAFVFRPVVGGELLMKACHKLVAVSLGEDGCGGNVAESSVAFDKCGAGHVAPWMEFVAVNDYRTRGDRKSIKGAVHGEDGCLENIDAVDFGGLHHNYGPGYCLLLNDGTEGIAARLGKLLAVVEPGMREIIGENDGSSAHRTGETSASGFIASGLKNAGSVAWRKGIVYFLSHVSFHKTVAEALTVDYMTAIFADFLTQAGNSGVNGALGSRGFFFPSFVNDFRPLKELISVPEKHGKNEKFCAGEGYLCAINLDSACAEVDFKGLEAHDGAETASGCSAMSTNNGTHTGYEFARGEGLGEIVVGTGIKSVHYVIFRSTRTNNDYRHMVGVGIGFYSASELYSGEVAVHQVHKYKAIDIKIAL